MYLINYPNVVQVYHIPQLVC